LLASVFEDLKNNKKIEINGPKMLRSIFRPTTTTTAKNLLIKHQQRRGAASSSSSSPANSSNNSTTSLLESDTGALGTKVHHLMSTSLALLTPVYFLTPDRFTDGAVSRGFGTLLSINAAVHSWIGLNYVARDYVPKISYALLGPARIAIVGLSVVTLFGMAKISLASPGGLKAVVKGAWNPPPKQAATATPMEHEKH
jgi:succinate dehydrogenase hydrophobic anchor subunit